MANQWPWVIQFNGTSKPALVAPFDGCRSQETDMAALQGKRCLGLDGDWLLMLDELTRECSLTSFANGSSPSAPTVISLPPLPEDTMPPLCLRFGCALSNQTPPDCTVMLDFVREKSLLYCRPGDNEWSRLLVEFAEEGDEFDGPITPGHHGKVYATTMASLVAVDASGLEPAVEKTDINRPPPCPAHAGYKCYPVPCPGGELFLVRCCIFGNPTEVVDLKVFRWIQEDVCGGFGIYTVSLDDMTIGLSMVKGCVDDDGENEVFWALPSSFGLEASGTTYRDGVTQRRIKHCCKEEEKEDMPMSTAACPEERQWCDLQTDLWQLLVTKISFIDYLHVKAVCKQWNSIVSPIQDAKVSPLLMTSRPGRTKDLLEVFDPVSEKKYQIRISIPASDLKSQGSHILHFTKNGWVIVSRGGDHMFFLVNPFRNYPDGGNVIALPALDVRGLKGVSFSSVPGSPDFVVLAARTTPDGEVIMIHTWRLGDEDWKDEYLRDNRGPFLMASHSPVFLDGLFYFLDINGRLGVVDSNEDEMEWNGLEKPDQPIRGSDEVHLSEWDYIYVVEWKRELIAIVRENGDDGFISTFKLDRSRMVWSELEEMEDAAVFWDRSNAVIAMPPLGEDSCNKIFLPNYSETEGGGRMQVFYSLKGQQYYPSFYAKEPMNAIWFEPNLEDILPVNEVVRVTEH
ncbi:unnamed protein product [Alopecurus aequalis]